MTQSELTKRRRKPRHVRSGAEDPTHEVALLMELDLPVLREKWQETFGAEPSPQIGRTLLLQALAYRVQERLFGGLKPSVQRILDQIIEDLPRGATRRVPKTRATAGTVLIREWRGIRHRVAVFDRHVVYGGRRYASLSEVARAITGTHWSGPLFFGLKSRTREAANG